MALQAQERVMNTSDDEKEAVLDGYLGEDEDADHPQPMDTDGECSSDEEAASGSTIQSLQGVLNLMTAAEKPLDEVSGPLHGLHISDLPTCEQPVRITKNDTIVQVGRIASEVDGVFIVKVLSIHMLFAVWPQRCCIPHCIQSSNASHRRGGNSTSMPPQRFSAAWCPNVCDPP